MQLAILYFSASGNTEKIKNIIRGKLIDLGNDVKEFNLTDRKVREEFEDMELFDAIIFGFPIFYWRAPRVIRDWLETQDGLHRKCSVFFTYGGVNSGIAHYDIKQILEVNHFKLVVSAEFLGKHTYNAAGFQFMENRPNLEDYEIAREFGAISHQKFLEQDVKILSIPSPIKSKEEVDNIELNTRRVIPIPFIDNNICTECGICEVICPTNAMVIIKGKPQRKNCIRCLRCLYNCPENAIKMPNMYSYYKYIRNLLRLTDELLEEKKSKIYC